MKRKGVQQDIHKIINFIKQLILCTEILTAWHLWGLAFTIQPTFFCRSKLVPTNYRVSPKKWDTFVPLYLRQIYALYWQREEVLPFVLHIETCQRDKWFLSYLQNQFEKRIFKFWYIRLCTIQEHLKIYEIIRLVHMKMIRLGHENGIKKTK